PVPASSRSVMGLRGVRVKGGNPRDIPLPSALMNFLTAYIERVLCKEMEIVDPDTPLFWSSWGRRAVGETRAPMTGKNIWRLCKVYGRRIGYPELEPHDLRHGVAMEVLEQHHARGSACVTEEVTQAQSVIDGKGALPIQDLGDAVGGDLPMTREPRDAHTEPLQLFGEDAGALTTGPSPS